ncbi:alpha/beta fold hydrolase [Arthrobacter bambusae]|uniref:alpha/beta fold hydrolase n=1 Tax=Arthrobacter bambusae TaxID=1338426 RepID=UPI002782C0F2|nr:alpha/beta hydrolase [Arthrobacter bambusae]MDQ0029447.1 pimeloyl-ACP methyl ester carboxylesterase [Arthrobacter bambusae]MDQ0097107.1 pimeloyl-ACP methyl ester carboxylesterase [Arthrobacter bambusae]
MSEFAISKDGTRIGYDQYGEGPAVILVGGAMQFRGFDANTVEMAKLLSTKGFTVVNYDRRGRGESAEATSLTLQDNIDDLAALIDIAGGQAALFGSSSGGSISLAAAAAGLPVTKLALWETPLSDELGSGGAEFFAGLQERIASGDKAATIEYYMKDMPPEWLAGAKNSPAWPIMLELGPSLSADAESLAWTQSAPRAELWSGITQPTLAIVGEQTIPIMPKAADSIVANIPSARKATIPGANHGWEPGVMADALAEFLAE